MSFSINGTVVHDSNFYSVTGDVKQVFNSYAPRGEGAQGRRHLAAPAPQCTLVFERTMKGIHLSSASLVVRSQWRPRQEVGWPYCEPRASIASLMRQDLTRSPATSHRIQHNLTAREDYGSTSTDTLALEGRIGRNIDDDAALDDRGFSLLAWDFPQHQNLQSSVDHMENNTYSIGGDMTQIKVTSYGESGASCASWVKSPIVGTYRDRYTVPLCRNGGLTRLGGAIPRTRLPSWNTYSHPAGSHLVVRRSKCQANPLASWIRRNWQVRHRADVCRGS